MKSRSIRNQIALVLIVLCTIIILVLGGVWLYTSYSLLKDNIHTSSLQDARFVANYASTYTKNISSTIEAIANSPYTIGAIRSNDTERLDSIVHSLNETIPQTDIIVITDETGHVLYNNVRPNLTNISVYEWYEPAMRSDGTYITGLYYGYAVNDNVFGIITAAEDNGTTIGYVYVALNPVTLQESIREQKIGLNKEIIVIGSGGKVVSHSNQSYINTSLNFSSLLPFQRVMGGYEGVVEYENTWDGQPRIAAYSPVPDTGWGVIVSTPVAVAYQPLQRQLLYVALLLIAFLLLSLVTSYYLSRYLADPILDLASTMKNVYTGNYSARASVSRKDEIGDLARTFNLMMGELEQGIDVSKKYQLIFERVRDPILFLSYEGKILDANEATVNSYGYSIDELLSMNGEDLRVPGEKEKFKKTVIECFDKGCLYETVHQRKDGSTFPVEVNLRGLTVRDRRVVAAVMRDITGRKQVERQRNEVLNELKTRSERTEAIIRSMGEGLIETDLTSMVVYMNPYARKAHGIGSVEEAKKTLDTFERIFDVYYLNGKLMPLEEWPSYRALKGETFYDLEALVRSRDGRVEFIGSYNGTPIRDTEGNIVSSIATFRDITERKRIERELEDARRQSDMYLDLMGHDINNLSQAGMGYLEMALDTIESEGKLDKKDGYLIEKSLDAMKNSSRLIDNVRKVQRTKEGGLRYQPIDICDRLNELKAQYRDVPGRDVTINIEHSESCLVVANELIKDVFANIISNAIRHSPPNRPLTIDISFDSVKERGVTYHVIKIEDTGPGIPDEVKHKLFTRFQRGETKATGKGLGLYLVRTLVEDFNGRVWVEDRVPGDYTKGARFTVMLPAYEDQPYDSIAR